MTGDSPRVAPRVRLVTVGATTARRGVTETRLQDLGLEVVPRSGTETAPVDLVIVHLKDGGAAAAAVAASAGRTSAPHVVITDTAPLPAEVVGAVAGGARGWLTSDVSDTALTGAVSDVLAGSVALSRADVGVVVIQLRRRSSRTLTRPDDGREVQLSTREWDVLAALASGAGGTEVAAMLGIDQATVRGYVASAVRRLRVRDRAEAVRVFRSQVSGSAT